MVSPLVTFPDPGNPNVFKFNGKLYHLNIKSSSLAINEEKREALTKKIVGLLNRSQLGERKQLDFAKIDQRGIAYSEEERTPFSIEQKDSFKSIVRFAHRQIPRSVRSSQADIHPPNTKALTDAFNEQFPFFMLVVGDLLQEKSSAGPQIHNELLLLQKMFTAAQSKKDFGDFLSRLNKSNFVAMMEKTYVPRYFVDEYKQWIRKLNCSVPITLEEASQNISILIQKSAVADLLPANFKNLIDSMAEAQSVGNLRKCFEELENLVSTEDIPKHLYDKLNNLMNTIHHELDRLPKTLSARVQQIKIPAHSKLGLLAEGFKHIFVGFAEKILSKFTRSMSGHNPQNTDPKLTHEHLDFDGKKIGKERVLRYDTIPQLIKSKETELDYLLKQPKMNKIHIEALKDEIYRYKHYHAGKNWVTSNTLREDFQNYKKNRFDALKTAPHPDQSYIPAMVNSRMHQIEAGNKSIAILRSGAIAYHPDGSKSFNQIKEKFIKDWAPPGVNEERFLKNPFEILKKSGDALKEDFSLLKRHERALIDQMVQYVSNQVGAHLVDITDPAGNKAPFLTGTLQITQVSMLDPKTKQDKKGLKKSEANQMRDMAEIFRMFNDKQIVFVDGLEAPFYSEHEGVIKLPKPKVANIPNAQLDRPLTLSCTFFNINVHGKDNGELKQINKEALDNLQKNLKQIEPLASSGLKISQLQTRYKAIKNRIEKGETTFDLAKEIILLQNDMQGAVGANCMSGKDRTGYLLARIADDQLSKEIDLRENLSDQEKDVMKKLLRRDLMSQNGMASEVVWQNTYFRFLKLKRFRVMGHNIGEGFAGHIFRLGYLIKSLGAVN